MEREDEVMALERKRTGKLEEYAKKVEELNSCLRNDLRELDQELASLMSSGGDLEVLVRHTPGPAVTVYHSAARPCGRVTGPGHSRKSYNTMLEARAKGRGWKRCTACNWKGHEHDAVRLRRT